jgi:hypothetical protein
MRDASIQMRIISQTNRLQGIRVVSFESNQLLLEKGSRNALEGQTPESSPLCMVEVALGKR